MSLRIPTGKADADTVKMVSEDLGGYVKVVVDVSLDILAAGGRRHQER